MKHWFSDVQAFRRDPLDFVLAAAAASREPLARMRLGPKPVYLVADPGLVKPILKADEAFIDKGTQRGLSYEYMRLFEEELNKARGIGNLKVHVVMLPMPRVSPAGWLLASIKEGFLRQELKTTSAISRVSSWFAPNAL